MQGLNEPRYDLVRFGSGFSDYRELQTNPDYRLREQEQLKSGLIQNEEWNSLTFIELEEINCLLVKYRERLLDSSPKLLFLKFRIWKLLTDNVKLEEN